jgi:hypothetical protein
MREIYILSILLCFFSAGVYSQEQRPETTRKTAVVKTPQEATIVVDFLDLPGRENEKSSWEVSYELRIIDEKSFVEAANAGKLKQMAIDEEKSGDFIAKNSFKKMNLSQAENRQVILKIPLDEKTRGKLKSAQKLGQVFLFYSSALIFDGRLKKNIIIPLSWIWRYEVYPDARFGMELKIEESMSDDGYSYSRKTFLPEKLPKGYFVIGSPSSKH